MQGNDRVMNILSVKNLVVTFDTPAGKAAAVDGISFDIEEQETLAIVGESGCGKTVTSLAMLRLIKPPGKIAEGSINFDGQEIVTLPEKELRKIRGKDIAMIFQEPMTALNPVFTIGNQIMEAITIHENISRKEARSRAVDLLAKVHIPSPEQRIDEYPHQLSGGMRQRAMIAMAISCGPKLIIADEPTTALDVTIQSQVLDLLMEMKEAAGASVMLITHDLGVVAQTCQRVAVMYAGKIVETAEVENIFYHPAHPYTKGLLGSIPSRHKKGDRLTEIKGMVPTLLQMPEGCRFHPRCPDCFERCRIEEPVLKKLDNGTSVACHLYDL